MKGAKLNKLMFLRIFPGCGFCKNSFEINRLNDYLSTTIECQLVNMGCSLFTCSHRINAETNLRLPIFLAWKTSNRKIFCLKFQKILKIIFLQIWAPLPRNIFPYWVNFTPIFRQGGGLIFTNKFFPFFLFCGYISENNFKRNWFLMKQV